MTDYAKELEKYKDELGEAEKQEIERLAVMQKDVAIGESAEDFIRHPFFTYFERHMNGVINDSRGEMSVLLKKPGVSVAELQAYQAGIDKISELKKWLNKHVIAGRVARQAIGLYERDAQVTNFQIQEMLDSTNEK